MCKRGGKRGLENGQFVVDRNTQRLEGALCGIPPCATCRCGNTVANDLSQLRSAHQRLALSGCDDTSGNLRGELFFPVNAKNPRNFLFRGRGQKLRCTDARLGVHSHIKRGIMRVREAPVLLVQLERRDTQIHEDPIDHSRGGLRSNLIHLVVSGVEGTETRAKSLKALRCEGDRRRISVDTENGELGETRECCFRVSTHSESRIDENSTGSINCRRKHVQALIEENRNMQLRGIAVDRHLCPPSV